jgi:hypothetical protein
MKIIEKRAMIAIIFAFAITLCIVIATIANITLSRSRLYVLRLKRSQAVNYAEAALYETFNRFRIGWTDAGGVVWNAERWADNMAGWVPTLANRTITIDGVPVVIDVIRDGTTGRAKVKAKVAVINVKA